MQSINNNLERIAKALEFIASCYLHDMEANQTPQVVECLHPLDRRKIISTMGQPLKWKCMDCGKTVIGDPNE